MNNNQYLELDFENRLSITKKVFQEDHENFKSKILTKFLMYFAVHVSDNYTCKREITCDGRYI